MDPEKCLWESSKVFAPDFPRSSSDDRTIQSLRDNRPDFVDALRRASESGMPGYYSVYSFPRGHPKNGNIPKVDSIFIDLDIKGDRYAPDAGHDTFEAWKQEMSALLARCRMIAGSIIEAEREEYFRVVLSGHKGLHLYLDFPEISPDNSASLHQFKNGLREYGENLMTWLDSAAGGIEIEPWVDVDASDLSRLARHPNTRHHGAAYDDEERWCVAITVDELADLDCDSYLDYTSSPRSIPDESRRTPSEEAGKKVVQYIRSASSSESSSATSNYDPKEVARYVNESNNDIELDDVLFLTSNKPCIEAFRERDDAYQHGEASRVMEISIIARMAEMGVPLDVMHEFFEPIPGYDENFTDEMIRDIIGREYREFNCNRICGTPSRRGEAEQFCLGDSCGVYRREDDLQKQNG